MKNLLRWLVIIGICTFLFVIFILGVDALFGLGWESGIKDTIFGFIHWIGNGLLGFFTGTVGNIVIGILIAITFYLLYRLVQKIKIWFGIPAGTPLWAILVRIFNKKAIAIIAIAVGVVGCIIYFYSRPDENDLAIQKVKLYEEMLAIYRIPAIGDLTEENIVTFKADDFLARTFCEFTTVELPKVKAKYLSLVKGDTAAETCSLRPQTNTAAPAVTDIPVSAPLPADADTIKDATIADPSPFFPEESPSPAKPAATAAPAKPATAPATRGSSGQRADDGRQIHRSAGNVQTGEFQGVSSNSNFVPMGSPAPKLSSEQSQTTTDDQDFVPMGDPAP